MGAVLHNLHDLGHVFLTGLRNELLFRLYRLGPEQYLITRQVRIYIINLVYLVYLICSAFAQKKIKKKITGLRNDTTRLTEFEFEPLVGS